MSTCDFLLLLLSPNLAMLTPLIRRHDQLPQHVMPIIIRPCEWYSQLFYETNSLPAGWQDNLCFLKANGERDQVWKQIATAIEERAKSTRDRVPR